MIKIEFSDIDWTNIDGQIIKMSDANDFYINSRLSHLYIPPVITEDSWGGKTFPVQITNWDGYIIEFASKEIGISLLSKIQSCSFLRITDTRTSEIVTADTQSSGAVAVEVGEKYMTTNQAFRLMIRSKKTCLYPAIQRLGTYWCYVEYANESYPYGVELSLYKTDIIPIKIINTNQIDSIVADNLINVATKKQVKEGYKMVVYGMNDDMVLMKKYFDIASFTAFLINPLWKISIENISCEFVELTEGLCKNTVTIITKSNVRYF